MSHHPHIPSITKFILQHSNKYPDLSNKNTPAVTIMWKLELDLPLRLAIKFAILTSPLHPK